MHKNNLLLPLLIAMLSVKIFAQMPNNKYVQFSGVVLGADSLKAVPFTSIMIRNSHHGTISDYYGYFSFVAQKGDTIDFSAIGYKKSAYVIPKNLEDSRYSLIHVMYRDTIDLKPLIVYPFPTKEEFKEVFLNLKLPNDDYDRAMKNLSNEKLREIAIQMPMDGSMNHRNYMQQYQSRLYYAGQLPPNNLLNPLAWANFIEAWRKGKLKRE